MTNEKVSRILAVVLVIGAVLSVAVCAALAVTMFYEDALICLGLAGVGYWAAASLLKEARDLLRRYKGDTRKR